MSPSISPYWVQWQGYIVDEQGNRVSPDDTRVPAFLAVVAARLRQDPRAEESGVLFDGTVRFSVAVETETKGAAVDLAWAIFQECVKKAGGSSEFPEGDHPSWSVQEIEGSPTEVRLLTAA